MAKRLRFTTRGSQTEQHRRPGMCVLMAERPSLGQITEMASNIALVATNAAPRVGARVELHHPECGVLTGNVVDVAKEGVRIAFAAGDRATQFALSKLGRVRP